MDALQARPDEACGRAFTPTLSRERKRGIAAAAPPWQSTGVTETSERRPAPRISFVSLGCPKALVDSERILTRLRAEGYELARTHAGADAVIVNTCGFLDSAKAESLAAIGEAMNENGRVIVTGCMGAEPEAIRDAFPNVLGVTGPQAFESVMAAVRQAAPAPHDPFVDLIPGEGVRLTPRHYAYLKIAEGCDNRCTFCIIPSLRGNLVSRQARRRAARGRAAGEGGRQGAHRHRPGHQRLRPRPQIRFERMARARDAGALSRHHARIGNARRLGAGCNMSTLIRMSTMRSSS